VSIGDRIRVARKAAGLSQEELARRASMSLNGFADIERGHIEDPHYSSLNKIADGLGVSISELLEEEQPPLAVAR
jgi:transcriptional regulator with XRE-family HTH domain